MEMRTNIKHIQVSHVNQNKKILLRTLVAQTYQAALAFSVMTYVEHNYQSLIIRTTAKAFFQPMKKQFKN
jgi:hypothetical protein